MWSPWLNVPGVKSLVVVAIGYEETPVTVALVLNS
jgi:hypothetical protein